jgi:hypothetical protein
MSIVLAYADASKLFAARTMLSLRQIKVAAMRGENSQPLPFPYLSDFLRVFGGSRMANRAMNAKLARARAQVREAAEIEFMKPCYIIWRHKQARYSWSV